jgi:hypothetical protein
MNHFHVPTHGPLDWKPLLAKPDLHWKPGRSAMALAQCWETARGFPPEVAGALESGGNDLASAELLLALPEYDVPLPGGERPSQTDLMVFLGTHSGLAILAVEGKVDEDFGPTVDAKRAEKSAGENARIEALESLLGFRHPTPGPTRYQLLHRTASAILTAKAFSARSAVMFVHTFSRDVTGGTRFDDYAAFCRLLGIDAKKGVAQRALSHSSPALYLGWCRGDTRFLSDLSTKP